MAVGYIQGKLEWGTNPYLTDSYLLNRTRPPTGFYGAVAGGTPLAGSVARTDPLTENDLALTGGKQASFFQDYYSTVYLIPASINFGAVTTTTAISFYVWNARITAQTLTSIYEGSDAGLSLSGPSLPTTFRRIEHKAYTLTASTEGPAYIDATYTFNFDDDNVDLKIFGSRAELWRLAPNWSQRYDITYAFMTDIILSRSGREQRRALRLTPRKTVEFTAVANANGLRWFNRVMAGWQNHAFLLPELTRDVRTTSAMGAGTQTVAVDAVPAWLTAGASVVLNNNGTFGTLLIDTIDNKTVTFTGGAATGWPIGTRVHPGLSGQLGPNLQTTRPTSDVATIPVAFAATPGLESFPDPAAPAVTFSSENTEVVLIKPNYLNAPSVTSAWPVEEVVYLGGVSRIYSPIQFGVRTWQATYLAADRDKAQAILDIFLRAKGRRGEFYMPTWEDDLPPTDDLTSGSFRLRTAGDDVANLLADDTVYRNVIVCMNDGTYHMNRVLSIDAITDENGTDSVLTMAASWPKALPLSDIQRVCWMPRWRFASDKLVISWLTDEVATITTAMSTLEDLT